MNAYELADWFDKDGLVGNMLRQQADRIAELEKDLHMIERHYDQLNTQTKPLSDEEIDSIIYSVDWAYDPVLLARAIEKRHGIK